MTTTRAYTIKLSGPAHADEPANLDWRERLWKTLVTANRGVQVWGDWLLTLRGGLPASVIDDPELMPVTEGMVKDALKEAGATGKESSQAEPAVRANLEAERVEKLRTILALSWLSVEAAEDQDAIDNQFIVAKASEKTEDRIATVQVTLPQTGKISSSRRATGSARTGGPEKKVTRRGSHNRCQRCQTSRRQT